MNAMRETAINGKWSLWLLEHRAARPEWPWWEAHTLALMRHLIEPGTVVWEVGAEEGDFPALYGKWGAEVVLIEPNPYVWPQIKIHWESNVDHPPVGWFVGLASDIDQMVETDYDDTTRGGWPVCAYDQIRPEHGFRHIWEHAGNTNQIRLDTIGGQWPKPDVITIDVEGGEGHVLRGLTETLTEHRPEVVVSVHPDFLRDLYQTTPDVIHRYMEHHGYEARQICFDHEAHLWYTPI